MLPGVNVHPASTAACAARYHRATPSCPHYRYLRRAALPALTWHADESYTYASGMRDEPVATKQGQPCYLQLPTHDTANCAHLRAMPPTPDPPPHAACRGSASTLRGAPRASPGSPPSREGPWVSVSACHRPPSRRSQRHLGHRRIGLVLPAPVESEPTSRLERRVAPDQTPARRRPRERVRRRWPVARPLPPAATTRRAAPEPSNSRT